MPRMTISFKNTEEELFLKEEIEKAAAPYGNLSVFAKMVFRDLLGISEGTVVKPTVPKPIHRAKNVDMSSLEMKAPARKDVVITETSYSDEDLPDIPEKVTVKTEEKDKEVVNPPKAIKGFGGLNPASIANVNFKK